MLFALTLNPIGILIWLVLFCLCVWAVRAILSAFGIGDPIATIVQVVIVIVFVLYLVQLLGGGSPGTLRLS